MTLERWRGASPHSASNAYRASSADGGGAVTPGVDAVRRTVRVASRIVRGRILEHLSDADARQRARRGAKPSAERRRRSRRCRRGRFFAVPGPGIPPAGWLSCLAPLATHCITTRRQGYPGIVRQGSLAGVQRRRSGSVNTHVAM